MKLCVKHKIIYCWRFNDILV